LRGCRCGTAARDWPHFSATRRRQPACDHMDRNMGVRPAACCHAGLGESCSQTMGSWLQCHHEIDGPN
jgi:hypothetical protein